MWRRSHLFLGITSTFEEQMSLAQGNNTPTRLRIEPGSPDPESDALTTRPVHSPEDDSEHLAAHRDPQATFIRQILPEPLSPIMFLTNPLAVPQPKD